MSDGFPSRASVVPKWLAQAGALGLLFAPQARAEVIEIGADGDITRLNGPAMVTESGTSPISAPAPARASRARLPAFALASAGRDAGLSPNLIEAVAWTESRFNPSARSPAGAEGLMQLMPATAAALGVDARQPDQNLRGGAVYLRQMLDLFENDLVLALAAYNAGPEAVRRYGGVPPYRETQAYVASVLDFMANDIAEENTP